MRRIVAAAVTLLVFLSFIGCDGSEKFVGTKTTDGDSFIIDYSVLDGRESARMTLEDGDRLSVSIRQSRGDVDLTIRIEGEEPIYEGKGILNFDFTLNIQKGGVYLIEITGRGACGSASFVRKSGNQSQSKVKINPKSGLKST